MAEIRIHRDHELGLKRAREIAWAWAEQVEAKFDMACTVIEGKTSDTVEFTRSGVKGELIVAAKHFELSAKLGLLLGAFKSSIEGEIQKELDALLSAEAAKPAKAASKAAGKKKPA
ncbi:polyhydroxyalkanoic acid system family protein [Roseateles sp.]|uniref:polyhydroxyalkanoic acid system family protein n=1 Tax=Roseateles sp. TaxID=1971397 RepID=UPI003BA438E6